MNVDCDALLPPALTFPPMGSAEGSATCFVNSDQKAVGSMLLPKEYPIKNGEAMRTTRDVPCPVRKQNTQLYIREIARQPLGIDQPEYWTHHIRSAWPRNPFVGKFGY